MQLRLPWSTPPARERAVEAGGRWFPVEVVRHRRARRYILRVTNTGGVRVTVPRGASIAGGLAFAHGHADWIATEWARRTARTEWQAGTSVWYRGVLQSIVCGRTTIRCGPSTVSVDAVAAAGGLRAAFQARWRDEAGAELPDRCRQLGDPFGLRPARVHVRNQQSRWGSCSTRGNIALNWRLVQMPPEVADYVMLHELVHLEHPNHSPRFWRRVNVVCPGWRSAEGWLRASGRDLL